LITETTLQEDVNFYDDIIVVNSTKGWPREYGLLKIDDEIITYTGITTNSFTGCVRGFSGIDSLTTENNPEFLSFSSTNSEDHSKTNDDGSNKLVKNLSNLFLVEFFKKIKYHFAPGFEELEFDEKINPQNFISKVRTFYQSKGTDESHRILFKVLYNENVEIIKPQDFCFTPSDDKWVVTENFLCELVSGNPLAIKGETLYQDSFLYENVLPANGSIYEVEECRIQGNKFYSIKIFSGYSNNLNPKGSISGKFSPTLKTFTIDSINPNATEVFVDSTIGFPNSGSIIIGGSTVSYTDKTNDQFLNCSGISTSIAIGEPVYSNNYVYSYEDGDSEKPVILRIHNVLSRIDSSNILYSYPGDPIQITDIGDPKNSTFVSSLVYNHPLYVPAGIATSQITNFIRTYNKEGIDINSGLVLTKYRHNLKPGDILDLYLKNTGELKASNLIVNTVLEYEFSVQKIEDSTLLGKEVFFKRRLKKTKSPANSIESISNKFIANIQDSFSDNEYYYLTSNGIPSYEINPYKREFKFSVNNETLSSPHNFYTGELVTVVGFTTSGNFQNKIGINTNGNSYYVYRINNNLIKLSESRENVGFSSYISFNEYNDFGNLTGSITEIKLISSPLFKNNFTSSKLFKKIPRIPQVANNKPKTNPGPIGIFVNGVELQNYKSFDKLYYGKIDSVTVLDGGENYSLLNPIEFKIFDGNVEDTQTKLIPQLEGKLKRIDVIDSGFDYLEVPTVTILGGNNTTVVTEVKLKEISNSISFNSTTKDTVVNTSADSFIFNNKHRFVTGEAVIYKTFGTRPIGIGTLTTDGTLLDGSVYYVVNVGAGTSFKIAKSKEDSLSFKNLNLRTNGGGIHQFISLKKRKCVDEIQLIENNNNFYYKKLSVSYKNINVYDDIFTIPNHGFKTGEEVRITSTPRPDAGSFKFDSGTESFDSTIIKFNSTSTYTDVFLIGIELNKYYYIVKIDENRFRLSHTQNEINYVDIISVSPLSTYFVEYSPIRVVIEGNLTVSGISTIGYDATLKPIIEGTVTSVHVQEDSEKIDLGSKEIVNYNSSPKITPIEGSDATFEALVVDGRINEVVVKTSGKNYFNNFELQVTGDGYGAKLSPVIVDGKITQVKIISSGVGYSKNNIKIKIVPVGSGLKLKSNLQTWTINEIDKIGYNNVEKGILFGKKYSLFGNIFGVFFLNSDLRNQLLIQNNSHSPIVGWAYDGCPIYGPFGYKNSDGTGGISRMRSGYTKNKISPSALFDCVEDYVFTNSGTLDKHNGRYCVTPEFPKGVYAYFCTLTENNIPEFPYVIGDEYQYSPILENFDLKYNQTIDFNSLSISKCTYPYRIEDKKNRYQYFNYFINENLDDAIITESTSGRIDRLLIANSGDNYEVGDAIVFDNSNTDGFGAYAKVSEILGVGVTSYSSNTLSLNNITFTSNNGRIIGICTQPHNLQSNYYVNILGISTNTYSGLEGFKTIFVESVSVGLSTYLPSSTATGLVTSIQIKEAIDLLKVNCDIKIENETLKIIGIDKKNNLINVLRNSGQPDHLQNTPVVLLQNEFIFQNDKNYKLPESNISYYFKSSESVSVGLGTTPGSGNILSVAPLGYGVSETKFVRTGGIFLPENKFKDGEKVKYTPSTSTIVTNKGNLDQLQELYIINLESNVVGLVTSKNDIKDSSKLLYYTATGTGSTHKFETDREVVTGNLQLNNVIVSTGSTHGLSKGDYVKLYATSGITTEFTVSYSNSTKRVLINSQTNPRVDVYENDTVKFNVSSSTLTNFDFNFYTDPNFKNKYFGTPESGIEVKKSGSYVTLNITDHTPKLLYYNLESLSKEIYPNDNIIDGNKLIINKSAYGNEGFVINSTSNTFTLNYPLQVERSNYNSTNSVLYYSVLSPNVKGSILNTKFDSKGINYKKAPLVKEIQSKSGNGAYLLADSDSIGKIKRLKVLNTKSILPSDKTLNPISNIFSSVRIKDNFEISSISVLSGGKNYLTAPTLQLYNKKEDKIIDNFVAEATLKNNSIDSVVLLNPGFGLQYTDNQIVSINNSNGIRILGVSVVGTSSPFIVTLTLETPLVGFTTSNPLDIQVGDKIFIEGVSHTGGTGYNCSGYKYEPFVVTYTDPALGSTDAAQIRYELPTNPGTYIEAQSFDAKVIKYDYLPKFEATLTESEFFNAEQIGNTNIINNDENSKITNLIKVKNSDSFAINQTIFGEASKARGKVFSIDKFTTSFKSDSSSSEDNGWKGFRGNLSSILQKLPDNDYYQRFSYSLKSKQQISTWEPVVSDLNHVSGYKKFGDMRIESVGVGNSLPISSTSSSAINIFLDGYADVNTISSFDLVSEEDVDGNDSSYSENLKFRSKKLSNFLLSNENRVLSIDDISGLFDNDNIPAVEITIDTVNSNETIVFKYLFFIASTVSFLGDFEIPQFFEVIISRDDENVNLISYGYFYGVKNTIPTILGEIKSEISETNSDEIVVSFIPKNPFNSYSIRVLKEVAQTSVGISTLNIGYNKNIELTNYYPGTNIPTKQVFYTIPTSECNSGTVFVGISSIKNSIQNSFEFSFININGTIEYNLYSENNVINLGSIDVNTNGSNIEFSFDPIANIDVTVHTNLNLLVNTLTAPSTQLNSLSKIESGVVTFNGDGPETISLTSIDYSASKYALEIQKDDGMVIEKCIVQLDTIHFKEYLNIVEYGYVGDLDMNELEFNLYYNSSLDSYVLSIETENSANYTVKFFKRSLSSPN
jgi:YHYH protein